MHIDRSFRAGTFLLLMSGAAALAGCTPNDVTFGGAVRQDIAAQIVDPDPQYDKPAATSGDKMADAVERYRTDKVKKPVSVKTTSLGSSSSR